MNMNVPCIYTVRGSIYKNDKLHLVVGIFWLDDSCLQHYVHMMNNKEL
jgi:hypothetical protein